MSVVLAFGLSPIGQGQAYAAQKGEQPAAEEILQTQAFADDYSIVIDESTPLSYRGAEFVSGGVTASGATTYAADELLRGVAVNGKLANGETASAAVAPIITVYHRTVNASTGAETWAKAAITTGATASDTTTALAAIGLSGYEYRDSAGKVVTEVKDAGTYKIVFKGAGALSGYTVEKSFTIAPFDLGSETATIDASGITAPVTYNGSYQAVVGELEAADLTEGIAAFELDPDDYSLDPSMVMAQGSNVVKVKAKSANLTGENSFSLFLARGTFNGANLTVNGATLNNDAISGGAAANTFIDLGKAKKNPSEASPDPLAFGNVKYGDTKLAKDGDAVPAGEATVPYKAYYYGTTDPNVSTELSGNFSNAEAAAPTAVGGPYYALLVADSQAFATTNTVAKVKYSVTGVSLDEAVDRVELGSATYMPVSASKSTDTGTTATITSNTVVAPSSVKFTKGTSDVTAKIGDNYTLAEITKWKASDEKLLLGDEEYAKRYPYADEPYANDNVDDSFSISGMVDVARTGEATETGYEGLRAGDYKVAVYGTGEFESTEPVFGKFTVTANTPTVGSSAGQLVVTPGSGAIGQTASTVTTKPAVKMILHKFKSNTPEYAKATATTFSTEKSGEGAFAEGGDATKVAATFTSSTGALTPEANAYYVTYKKDGKEISGTKQFTESGTYSAVLHFSANYGNATVEVPDALTVGKETLQTYLTDKGVKTITVTTDGTNAFGYYTGKATAPKVKFLKQDGTTEVEVDPAFYTVKFAYDSALATQGATIGNEIASTSGGLPVGVGTYTYTLEGAGDYQGSIGTSVTAFTWTNANIVIRPLTLDLDTTGSSPQKNAYFTVQYDDNGKWVENYSTTLSGSEVKPAVRLVTTATKNDASPVVVDGALYKVKYSNNTASGKQATATLSTTLTQETVNNNHIPYVAQSSWGYPFYIASGTFADAGITAVTLGEETSVFDGKVKSPTVTVAKAGSNPLQPQYSGSTLGDYVYTITDPEGNAVSSTDYADADAMASHTGILHAGKYTITVTGGQSAVYAGTLTATYEVTPKALTQGDVNEATANPSGKLYISNTAATIPYDGTEKTGVGSVQYKFGGGVADITMKDLADYPSATGATYSATDNKKTEAGDYTASITFSGDFSGTVTQKWAISAGDLNRMTFKVGDKQLAMSSGNPVADTNVANYAQVATADLYTVEYNGKAQEPAIKVLDTNGEEVDSSQFTFVYADNVNASASDAKWAKVTIIGSNDNYTGRAYRYFPITNHAITSDRVKVAINDEQLKYNGGDPVEPVPSITYTNKDGETFALTQGVDFTLQYPVAASKVGDKGTVKIIGLEPNFDAVEATSAATFITRDFEVQAAPIEQEIAASNVSLAYGATKKVTASAKTELTYVPDNSGVYSVDAAGNVKALKVGSGKLTIKAAATDEFKAAEKVITVKVTKAKNTKFKVTAKKKSYAAKTTAKKVFKASALYKVTGKAGKVTYKKANTAGAKKIVVAKNGKITVKKGLKAGTYKVKVKATSAANANYKAASKNVTIKVKVTKK